MGEVLRGDRDIEGVYWGNWVKIDEVFNFNGKINLILRFFLIIEWIYAFNGQQTSTCSTFYPNFI